MVNSSPQWLVELFNQVGQVDPSTEAPPALVQRAAPPRPACWKCGGTGYLPHYHHRAAGACFACAGRTS